MDPGLRRALEEGLAVRGEPGRVASSSGVAGGCIHRAEVVELDDGRRLFVKSNAAAPRGMFEAEATGLSALAAVDAIRVPRDPWVGEVAGGAVRFLAMEAIEEGRAGDLSGRSFFGRFGAALAELHRAGRGSRFGFDGDNYLGSTPQPNAWHHDWVEFFRRRRLGFQLDLARRGGLSDATLDRLGDRLLDRLDEWIDLPDEPPALIHGDLWSGNFLVGAGSLVGEEGEPVLVDPAVYYAHREAELAMTRLFGGFDADFYSAYEEAWPLPPGTGERQRIYGLYHLLNHLNLFGAGYRGQCVSTLRSLVGS